MASKKQRSRAPKAVGCKRWLDRRLTIPEVGDDRQMIAQWTAEHFGVVTG